MRVRVVAVRIHDRQNQGKARPILIGSHDLEGPISHVLWGIWGPTYAVYEEDVVEVVEEYGIVETGDYDAVEVFEKELVVKYNEKYPIKPANPANKKIAEEATGFCAPDGRYFDCRYEEHRGLASALIEMLYLEEKKGKGFTYMDNLVFLDKMGWARLQRGGVHVEGYDFEKITAAQKRTLLKLMGACSDKKRATRLARDLRRAEGADLDWEDSLDG